MKYSWIISLFLPFCLLAQELPPIQNYSPAEYQAENQNWGLSQSEGKLIYAANSEGLLQFNGAKWTLYPSSNETIIRSVLVVGDKIYTGCYMEFGFWTRNEKGQLEYTSLSKKIAENLIKDEEFWGIAHMDDWILFQSLNRIYVYNVKNDSVNIINSESTLFRMFKVAGSIYFQKSGQGIFKIESGDPVLVYDDEPLTTDEVINMFQREEGLLLVTKSNGLFMAQGDELKPWNSYLDEINPKISVYSAIQLSDNTLALGTISNGLMQLNENGELLQQISQRNGLRNNTVLSLMEDVDHNIWMGLDNGISYVDLNSPIEVYHDNAGVVGSIYASIVKDDILYLGTNQGLFYRPMGDNSAFILIDGTQGQVWCLENIDETLFCGHHRGTLIVEGAEATLIPGVEGTWKIGSIPDNPNWLLQGNYDGLYVMERVNDRWSLRNKISGFDHSSRYVEVLGDKIFVNHEYKGIFSMDVDADYQKAQNVSVDTTLMGSNSGIIKYGEQLLYSFRKGIFAYDTSSNTFKKDSLLSSIYDEDNYASGKMLHEKNGDDLWIFTRDNIGIVSQGELADTPIIQSIALKENMRSDIVGYENVSKLDNTSKYLIGSSSGYLVLDLENVQEKEFEVNIAHVLRTDKNRNTRIFLDLDGSKLKSDERNLEFDFFASEYNKYLKTEYQFQLEGMYDTWSNWSESSTATFENLPHGDYTFRVRAKIGDTYSSNVATYNFTIQRPWYLSNLFILIYIVAIGLLVFFVHQAYRRYYHKKQEELIQMSKKEIELTKAQNEKDIIKIKNEQLKEEFTSKSNELAASTLSIIRKNELLSKVKEQLVSNVEDKDSIKPIIKIIDKNLNQNDDWELFKEAFNNADRKFLKKLKSHHPKLSPNDVRLCAYLRLNLSSKEIAPLLNISVRSVEIKRYRLRKKMNLAHEDNLVDYIISL